ncbi:PQQ-binding-like beta-propeller repeat protein [Planctomycetes bacterium K23_9]|uniref:Outer membrane biogenesis protein BamB n=1 Tax=Stieleria marina TaxID=1930275 RepID=A0A517NTL4_9BACT|nr:outer membrane biogenesis protein BamB [Planctomycetes bacterium K23_9]
MTIHNRILLSLVIAAVVQLSALPAMGQAVWPAFLGQGKTQETHVDALPLTWSPSKNVRWKTTIPGKGQSSPVVWGDTAYVTSIAGNMKETCIVTAISITTGQQEWSREFESAMPTRSNYFQSRSAPTPVVDDNHVVAFFETGSLVGINRKTGNTAWQRSLTTDYGAFESTIGLATSPVQLHDRVFLMIDHEGESYLLAVDKLSGETIWRTERFSRKSYASPSIIDINGSPQIVCSSDGSVDGYDPKTGKQLWTFEELGANSSNTPLLASKDSVLIGASPGMRDVNMADARESNLCLRIVAQDDGFKPQVQWKSEKAVTTFASPMAHIGYAYWVTNAGVVFCYEVESGELMYRKRAGEQCWVTPIGVGDRVYLFGKGGQTTVLAAGPDFRVLAENELWDLDSIPATDPGQFSGRGGRPPASDAAAKNRGASLTAASPDAQPEAAGPDDAESENARPDVADSDAEPSQRPGRPASATAGKPSVTEGNPADVAKAKPMDGKEIEAARTRGENRFADPVQYGVALTADAILIRTGSQLHCISKGGTK